MKMRIYLLIVIPIVCLGCGQDSSSLFMADESAPISASISAMQIEFSSEPVKVGVPVQMWIKVALSSGESVGGVTTKFVDPESAEEFLVEWESSDEDVARVDNTARLIPVGEGYVTISASFKDVLRTRSIRVEGNSSGAKPHEGDVSIANDAADNNDGGIEIIPNVARPPTRRPPLRHPDREAEQGQPDPGQPEPVLSHPCQTHAVSVASFSAGAGAGFGQAAFPNVVLGPPHGAGATRGSTDVLSLGTHGEIVLDLGACALVDGTGVDLIVFENPFLIGGNPEHPYAELGVVGVSEDGENFVEFSCDDGSFPYTGCAGWNPVYASPSNRISPFDVTNAGGDPFDLEDIGVDSARYVRIRDLNGSGLGGTAGFDLDGISVVNGVEAE